MAKVTNVDGIEGNFQITILQKPRYVDINKCIACGICSEKCPKKNDDRHNCNLIKRKAIYIQYPQAVPLKYIIDENECIYLKKGKCRACEKKCPSKAINFEESLKTRKLYAGSIIIATGFDTFDPQKLDTYGYAKYDNVITSLELERILSPSGPTEGNLIRISDGKKFKNIAWFQCVGSRDINKCDNFYCSSICCMYAIKEAMIIKEHDPKINCTIFYMDIRTHGKDFEYYYERAKNKGIRFIRSKVHTINPLFQSGDLSVRYISEEGTIIEEIFNKIVLSVGIEMGTDNIRTLKKLGIDLTKGNFCKTYPFTPVTTSKKGIYTSGTSNGPKDIPQSVIDGSAAAAAVGELLNKVRNTQIPLINDVPEINVKYERPKVGIFICMCGSNISGTINIKIVKKHVEFLPYVELVNDNLYSCSKDSQDNMVNIIQKNKLNRIVVAACSPKTHENLFKETLVSSGLNKYLFEMCNIRNQNSWVHKNDPEMATEKAIDLIRMAVAKVSLMEPLKEAVLNVNQVAMVIGGGISGMIAAENLAKQGYKVNLIEKSNKLGGNALNIYKTSDEHIVEKKISKLINKIKKNKNIKIYINTKISEVNGFVGNFKTKIKYENEFSYINHGIVIIATGAKENKPYEYLYDKDPRVITNLEFDKKLINKDKKLKNLKTIAFIQCVGSRDNKQNAYCSRVCCSHSISNAIELKKYNPKSKIYIIYRDIRTYGEKENLYIKARKLGVIFIRYSLSNKPSVFIKNDNIILTVQDNIINKNLEIIPDILILASSIVPKNNLSISKLFKIPIDNDGFFIEKHAKLGPSEFSTEGIFLCGLAHYPKTIDESISQSLASVSKATTLLSKKKINNIGTIATVNHIICSSCLSCINLCPYSSVSLVTSRNSFNFNKAEINTLTCKGCGICVASCRSGAISLKGFDNNQIFVQISNIYQN